MQLPLLLPDAGWRPPRLADLPSWEGAKRVAIDIETCDPNLKSLGPGMHRDAYIAGVAFCIEDSRPYYLPIRHAGGDNIEDVGQAYYYLEQQFKNFTGDFVGANLNYDLGFLWANGLKMPNGNKFQDVQVAEALITEFADSYSLEALSSKYLGVSKEERLLREAANAYGIDAKKDLHLLPARYVGEYAEADTRLPLLILRRQEPILEQEKLWKVYKLESDLLPILVKMRARGIRIDLDKLDQVEKWTVEKEKDALNEIFTLTGVKIPFNAVWQATALAPALQEIGVKIPLTPKTKKPSIDKKFLSSINHPVARAIQQARRVNKIRTTFAQSMRDHMVKGRIHCTIHQLRSNSNDDDEDGEGARFGRVSCSHPNLQQQPSRDPEIGPLWRQIFIPEESKLWASCDFSSQEPRQAVHYATQIALGKIKVRDIRVDADKSAKLMAEKYRTDPLTDPHQFFADTIRGDGTKANKEERSNAKILFLGLSYGMGGAKLCRSLGLPTIMAVRDPISKQIFDVNSEEGQAAVAKGGRKFEAAGEAGQALLDKFDEAVPFVRALARKVEEAARSRGYIRTSAGRKCRFPTDAEGNFDFTYKSLNRLIQGSAADQTKIAMVAVENAGYYLQLQIHDELAASVNDLQEAKSLAELMENCYQLAIPSRVDVECGKSWGEAK